MMSENLRDSSDANSEVKQPYYSFENMLTLLKSSQALSLPIVPMIDLMIDFATQLASRLQSEDGVYIIDPDFPELKWTQYSDQLGNQYSYEIQTSKGKIRDKELSKFFHHSAKIFVRIKRKLLAHSAFARAERLKQEKRLYGIVQKFYQTHSTEFVEHYYRSEKDKPFEFPSLEVPEEDDLWEEFFEESYHHPLLGRKKRYHDL